MWVCMTGDRVLLDETHIIPSIQITFSRCRNVRIEEIKSNKPSRRHFVVFTENLPGGTEMIFDRVIFRADEPTHL